MATTMATTPKTPAILARRTSAAAAASPSVAPSPDDLARFYKALTASFNKIQTKDQKSQLINAAKRSTLSECFRDHEEVLTSYLGYLQVFAHISGDTFDEVVKNVIVPTFKMDVAMDDVQKKLYEQIHKALANIFKENPELGHVYISCLGRNFPSAEKTPENIYLNYVYNVIRSLDYLTRALSKFCVTTLIDKIVLLEIVTSESSADFEAPQITSTQECDRQLATLTDKTIALLYDYIDELKERDDESLDKFFFSFVNAFQRVVVGIKVHHIHYLAFYLCSLKDNYAEDMIAALWNSAAENDGNIEERRACLAYISSLLSRARYIDFERALGFLDTAIMWCHSFLDIHAASASPGSKSNVESMVITNTLIIYYLVCQSIFYIIAQRHRDLYDPDNIDRIIGFNLNRIINSHLKPLHFCQPMVAKRFEQVCDMYEIAFCADGVTKGNQRSKFSKSASVRAELNWYLPISESDQDLPDRLKPLFRLYFDCSNFTVRRDK